MRVKRSKDINLIKQLHKEIFPYDTCDVLDTDIFWIVINQNNKAVGFCTVRPLECGIAYFNWAGLLSEATGQGLHRRMIRAREKWCRKENFETIVTYTTTDNIPSAKNLIRCKYDLFTPEYDWAGEELLYFRKNI